MVGKGLNSLLEVKRHQRSSPRSQLEFGPYLQETAFLDSYIYNILVELKHMLIDDIQSNRLKTKIFFLNMGPTPASFVYFSL